MSGSFNSRAVTDSIMGAVDTILKYEKQKKVEKKVQSAIDQAQKQGYKVSYKIDPETGMSTPTIESKEKSPYEDMMKELVVGNQGGGEGGQGGQGGQFEVSGIGPNGPRLTRKKAKFNPEEVGAAKSLLVHGQGVIQIKNPMTQQPDTADFDTQEGIDKAMTLWAGENWQKDPELVAAGLPQLYAQKVQTLSAKQDAQAAGAQPKIQPFTTSGDIAGRSVGGKAFYKEAAAKYGDQATAKIVDAALNYQKSGMPIAKIAELMKEQGIDPTLILKNYMK